MPLRRPAVLRVAYGPIVIRWLCAGVVGAILSGFAFLLVTGDYTNDGRVLFRFSATHGVHLGDLFVLAGWAVAMLALAVMVTPGRRSPAGMSSSRPRDGV